MSDVVLLDSIDVATPGSASWNAMSGDAVSSSSLPRRITQLMDLCAQGGPASIRWATETTLPVSR